MTERKRNVIVGLTTLAGLVGLIGLLLLFGWLPAMLQTGYVVRIQLPKAAGLHEGSRVTYSGIDIGTVTDVALEPPPGTGVVATALIREEVLIPAEAEVTVTERLIGGGATVAFVPPEQLEEDAEYLPRTGQAVVSGEVPSLAGTVSEAMENIETVTRSFQEVSAQWTQVGQSLDALMAMRDPGAVDRGEAPASIATVIQRLDSRLAEMEVVLAGINAYVGDQELRADVKQTIANARQVSDRVGGAVESLQESYVALADRLAATAESVEGLAAQAADGEGTLGRLINDPQLYENLNDAAERLQATLDEARLLVQKWKAEGLPVQF